MPAYLVVLREGPVLDADAHQEYQQRVRQMQIAVKPIPRVVYGDIQALAGDAPTAMVMMEFATLDDARAWYNNPDYQQALPFRLKGGNYRDFIVEGFSLPQ